MTQPGGSATINGILYQILGSLDWASRIRLNAKPDGEDLSEAQLIIEPTGGGGDIQLKSPGKRLIEQWKAKSDYGAWSLKEIIDKVLPDLYIAVDATRLDDDSEYRFVTEGHGRGWKEAQEFFQGLSKEAVPEDPLECLDGEIKVPFFPKEDCTQRELFQKIAERIRQRPCFREEPDLQTYQKIWHLLAHFKIEEECTAEKLRLRIDNFLLGVVESQEDCDAKRRELYGMILELAANGEVDITPSEILQRVGLSEQSLANWSSLRQRLCKRLTYRLQQGKYQAEQDVRQLPEWPAHFPILILSGESGQGKTWQLFKLASSTVQEEGLVVLIRATGNADQDLREAANVVGKDGLNWDNPPTLDRIAQRRRTILPGATGVWLTVCIDDVQEAKELRRLVEQDWEEWGIRLALTTSLSVGRSLRDQHQNSSV